MPRYGVREICNVVLRAKAAQKIGNRYFYRGEPVIYFDSLKTSSLEGASTSVYATGGRGNSRLIAWEGERTLTFSMEDALISPVSFMILSGAGLMDATTAKPIIIHTTEQLIADAQGQITLSEVPVATDDTVYVEDGIGGDAGEPRVCIYAMVMENDEISSEPYLMEPVTSGGKVIKVIEGTNAQVTDLANKVVFVDYYVKHTSNAQQIDITPDKFGGNYYLEASTLFRDERGVDHAAEFVIPNCKVQSNFTFTMASSGDPSTFNFVLDAFPDYTRWDKTKKVLSALQIIGGGAEADYERDDTESVGFPPYAARA